MLFVSKAGLEVTLSHLQSAFPHEGVGLWLGKAGRVERVLPLPNVHPSPLVGYDAEPRALVEALRQAEDSGLDLLAIYHSHPMGGALPSDTDRAKAYWRVPYVIVGLPEREVRAYRLPEGTEVAVHVE